MSAIPASAPSDTSHLAIAARPHLAHLQRLHDRLLAQRTSLTRTLADLHRRQAHLADVARPSAEEKYLAAVSRARDAILRLKSATSGVAAEHEHAASTTAWAVMALEGEPRDPVLAHVDARLEAARTAVTAAVTQAQLAGATTPAHVAERDRLADAIRSAHTALVPLRVEREKLAAYSAYLARPYPVDVTQRAPLVEAITAHLDAAQPPNDMHREFAAHVAAQHAVLTQHITHVLNLAHAHARRAAAVGQCLQAAAETDARRLQSLATSIDSFHGATTHAARLLIPVPTPAPAGPDPALAAYVSVLADGPALADPAIAAELATRRRNETAAVRKRSAAARHDVTRAITSASRAAHTMAKSLAPVSDRTDPGTLAARATALTLDVQRAAAAAAPGEASGVQATVRFWLRTLEETD
ncbi:hypothetical protein AMAG_15814 [Allomyces macrogynus ATCC 38327]|uniref:Uncharacterized protein n=1 Tax=Allomyces macrogynus (strain ATCC 38327) TaxID=578462 RepID=A0A0L0T8L1_ALLM3|nr:hypothetical protein AMAG_15814 [Allomyces macrogynus ATCC 38327]|eukprot:KNE71148.1 hypothetical protein AMAG_15814 [Allomyces macrogynus ATCC 38327]